MGVESISDRWEFGCEKRRRAGEVEGGGHAPCTLPHHSHAGGVTSKLQDIVLHPGERRHLSSGIRSTSLTWSLRPMLPGTSSRPRERKPRVPSLHQVEVEVVVIVMVVMVW